MRIVVSIFVAVSLVASIAVLVKATGGSYCDRHPGSTLSIGGSFITAECSR